MPDHSWSCSCFSFRELVHFNVSRGSREATCYSAENALEHSEAYAGSDSESSKIMKRNHHLHLAVSVPKTNMVAKQPESTLLQAQDLPRGK